MIQPLIIFKYEMILKDSKVFDAAVILQPEYCAGRLRPAFLRCWPFSIGQSNDGNQ